MPPKNIYLLLFLTVISCAIGLAQSNVSVDSVNTSNRSNSLNSSSTKLIQSISSNKDKEEITGNYYELSQELLKTGDYSKAELYLDKAIQMELNNKKKRNKNKTLANYYRELAKIQELQNKNELAAMSYEKAAVLTKDETEKQINKNDAARLKYKSSPKMELEYLNQNSKLLSNSTNNQDKFQNYTQMADANIALKQNDQALENYKDALTVSDSNSENSISIKSNMADLLAETENYDQAIDLQKQVVEKSQKSASVETQARQLRKLSSFYFDRNSAVEGLSFLKEAYRLAIEKGNLKEAKASLILMAEHFERNKENQQGFEIYKDFISQLDSIISRDSSLIDKSAFLINEGKIFQLEQEQALKDELIRRKNRYNYVLIGSVFLLLILLGLIIKAWFSIKKRNKQIALQSLRREMNPHFIFNSLNSVNQFIANNNELAANKYLSSYSNLMRNMMENSNKDYVMLNVEIGQLKQYLELEKLRFADKFEYTVEVEEDISPETVLVPNMIIQPNLENAIWHGLRYKESIGLLQLKFRKNGNKMMAIVEDNGIGLNESKNIKTKNQKLHESLGLKNVKDRIRLLNEIYKTDIRFEIVEKSGNESGVIVKIEW